MKGCAIDFETSGLDLNKDRIIEVGFTLFEVRETSIMDLRSGEFYVNPGDDVVLTPEAMAVNGIAPEDVFGGIKIEGLFNLLPKEADFFIAHNKAFDEFMYRNEAARQGLEIDPRPWLCSMVDFEHPKKIKCRKLSHMALDYGVAVNPDLLHRAAADTEILVRMLGRMNPDFAEAIRELDIPKITVKAIIPPPWEDGGKGKEAAVSCGFRWNGTKKIWGKEIRENKFSQLKEELGYDIAQV